MVTYYDAVKLGMDILAGDLEVIKNPLTRVFHFKYSNVRSVSGFSPFENYWELLRVNDPTRNHFAFNRGHFYKKTS